MQRRGQPGGGNLPKVLGEPSDWSSLSCRRAPVPEATGLHSSDLARKQDAVVHRLGVSEGHDSSQLISLRWNHAQPMVGQDVRHLSYAVELEGPIAP